MIAATVAAGIYALLTIAALLSTVSPTLSSLSSHGKTRALSHSGKNGTARCHEQQQKISVLRRWQQYLVGNNGLTMNKSRFIDFYATGIIISALILIYNANSISRKDFLPTCLFMTHLVRRFGECLWVHKPGAFSRMHVAGYLLGILHYLCLPFIMIPYYPNSLMCTSDNNHYTLQEGEISVEQCRDPSSSSDTSMTRFLDLFSMIGCVYFQYQQHRHHVILANLRVGVGGPMPTKTTQYSLPEGGWFEYASCPHYFSEIMIYVTFAILINEGSYVSREMFAEVWVAECSQYSIMAMTCAGAVDDTPLLDTLLTIHRFRNWILCLWVATNQAISAYTTHSWYRNSFGTEYPQQRNRLIPLPLRGVKWIKGSTTGCD